MTTTTIAVLNHAKLKPKRPRGRPRKRPAPILFQKPLLLYGDEVSQDLEQRVKRMNFDDALIFEKWRLEYLYLGEGLPHYRLYRGRCIIGVKQVKSPTALPRIRRHLAAYLAGLGFTAANSRLVVCGAKTSLNAEVHRLPHLF